MRNGEHSDCCEQRQYVARLIVSVINKRLCVREALLNFPKDTEDKSIKAAWYALCHLEADEEIRRRDDLYASEQDEYINYLAQNLSGGKDLPDNIVNAYEGYHDEPQIPHENNKQGLMKKLLRFLNV